MDLERGGGCGLGLEAAAGEEEGREERDSDLEPWTREQQRLPNRLRGSQKRENGALLGFDRLPSTKRRSSRPSPSGAAAATLASNQRDDAAAEDSKSFFYLPS